MRIPVSSIVKHQLPSFVRDEYPLFSQFLEQYYLSDQSEAITQNLDKNLDLDSIFGLRNSAILVQDVGFIDSTITVDSTEGFPNNYGLLQIDDEIILYESKNNTEFLGCTRGFSGVTKIDKEYLEFSQSELEQHQENSDVLNLSILYLKQFAYKIKKTISPGFEEREFFKDLNASNFIKNIKTFYSAKGSDESFRILFGALYGKEVDVIKPRDFIFRPSASQYRVTKDIIVEAINGDPYDLLNLTVYQDETSFIQPAQGTVIEINKVIRSNKDYYILSLDYNYNRDVDVSGTTRSEFSIHPKTLSTSKIFSRSQYIDVDSTVGFPPRGTLVIDLPSGQSLRVAYNSKVLNQFLDCSGIIADIPEKSEIKLESEIYGFNAKGEKVTMFVTGGLGDIDYVDKTVYYNKGEKIKIKTLGNDSKDLKANNWFFNVTVNYQVSEISIEDRSNFSYRVSLFDDHNFVIGDSFTLYSSDGLEFNGTIVFIEDEKNVIIIGQGQLNTRLKYTIRKNISKVDVKTPEYSNLSIFNSNVQNIYTDYENNVYVSSPSLPTYFDNRLEIKDFTVKVPAKNYSGLQEIEFNVDHGFLTGDSVVYKAANKENSIISDGIYFVYALNNRKIRLARSRFDIDQNVFVSFNGVINADSESVLEPTRFNDNNLNKLKLLPQNLVRKLSSAKLVEKNEETEPGSVGIFVNGVEISNFKSEDALFYGKIETVSILNPGDGYNVISPPEIKVLDPVGSGSSITAAVEGRLEKINIVDPGFNYIDTPTVSISGGGGTGAEAVVELVSYTHSAEFNSETSVNITENTIEFNNDHKFNNNEEVIYKTDTQKAIPGISTNSSYFVEAINAKKVKLYYSLNDSSSGINTISLSGIGTGIHSLTAVKAKKKISDIKVISPGSGYKNKRVKAVGINTAANSINIINHEYTSGEIITYYPSDAPIGGLDAMGSYYVTVVDENNIRLSGISTNGSTDTFFVRNEYINLTSNTTGNHYFNYPEIKVELLGNIGITTFAGQDLNAKIQPVLSGKIYSTFVENGGQKYGSANIINFEKEPFMEVEIGRDAQVTPVISNGSIVKVIVNYAGDGYYQIPDLVISPESNGAKLTPILSNGKLIEVIVINGGENFDPRGTIISVVPRGSGVKFGPKIESRRINLVQKLIQTKNISEDDGFIVKSNNSLEYTHLYAPRPLRKSVLRKSGNINVRDLEFKSQREQVSKVHSPLIGWAYDGNPIYGPYGFANGNSGPVKALRSGYEEKPDTQLTQEGRPPTSVYPIGFFVEDFIFTGNGDLDENNGRFCITPEYPNGVYAYFCTISEFISDVVENPFYRYFAPVFPYIIGPTYRNKKILDINTFEELGEKLLRNTTPYNLLNERSSYDFILNPNKIKQQVLEIQQTKASTISNIDVIDGGINYKINDLVYFNNDVIAKVDSILGAGVSSVGVSHTIFNNLEIIPFRNSYIGIFPSPQNISYTQRFNLNSEFELNKKITAVPYSGTLLLENSVPPASVTGIITYFSVSGNLDFPLKENDIFTVNDEKVKILEIDNISSRIKVQRALQGTVGITTHPINSILNEDIRKITFNVGLSTNYNFSLNTEFYFNPTETLGIGTASRHTLTISNPGLGQTVITIPTKSVYFRNHELASGDSLFYSTNGGSPIIVSYNGIGSTALQQDQELFVTKINNDLIGLSTQKSGVGSTDNTLFFTGIGTGLNHSFKTNYQDNLIGNLTKNTVTVSTASSHGLNILDNINVDVVSKDSSTYNVFYNDFNRRFCINKRQVESVNILKNTITSENHSFERGEKVIYVSESVVGGLVDQQIYYIIPITKDEFKISRTYYDSTTIPVGEIDLTSSGNGYFYSVNPKLKIVKDETIIFDVSDSSLAFQNSSGVFPGFELKLFYDNNFLNEYFTYDLTKTGQVGIDSTAKYTLLTKNLPEKIYYKIIPTSLSTKPEIFYDNERGDAFEIEKINSIYSGKQVILSATNNQFTYQVDDFPEKSGYNSSSASIKYTSNSTSIIGPINSVRLTNNRVSSELPQVVKITSENGINAILKANSLDIGKIEKVKRIDSGFDYSVDYTIRPQTSIPKILELETLYQLESITVQSRGFNYSYSPDLILIDSLTRKKFPGIKLDYFLEDNRVLIIEDSDKFKNTSISVIPINNDNGFDISEITFDDSTKEVTVILKTIFKELGEFPFTEGTRVYIENVPVIPGSNIKGYNSSNYGYRSFEITSSSPNLNQPGATFTYSLLDFIVSPNIPGVVDDFYTAGFAIPVDYLPIFNVNIKNNEFFIDETIKTNLGATGEVVGWDDQNNVLKVLSNFDIGKGEIIYGEVSKNYSTILSIFSPKGFIDVKSSSIVRKGWNDKIGFLNESLQRIHDSNYYQYFSYDLRSEVSYDQWTNVVDSLNHTTGFKKFGNLLVNSTHDNVGLTTSQDLGDLAIINTLDNVLDVNCYNDFDLATENYFNIDGTLNSNEIYFNSRRIQNYIESIGNKVFLIDDISDKFKPVIVDTKTVIDRFNRSFTRFKKYIIHIADQIVPANSQALLLNLLHNNNIVAINQYAVNDSLSDLGFFNAEISGPNLELSFSPTIISNKFYSVNSFSFNISDQEIDTGTVPFGTAVELKSYSMSGIGSTTILQIPNTKNAAKVLLVYSDLVNNSFYSDEINYIQDTTTILSNSYGELNLGKSAGIGTYGLYYDDNSNLNIDIFPNEQNQYDINILAVEFSDFGSTQTGEIFLSGNKLESSFVGIFTSGSPQKTKIYSYDSNYTSGLHQIVIKNTSNNTFSHTELVTMLNSTNQDVYSVEFSQLDIGNKFGDIEVEYNNGDLDIYFTPYQDIDYQVKLFNILTSKFRRSETLDL